MEIAEVNSDLLARSKKSRNGIVISQKRKGALQLDFKTCFILA